jgi:hypothetical protein
MPTLMLLYDAKLKIFEHIAKCSEKSLLFYCDALNSNLSYNRVLGVQSVSEILRQVFSLYSRVNVVCVCGMLHGRCQ